MILILLSLSIFLTYIGVMVKRNGIPESISDTFYSLKYKIWFGFSMTGISLSLMPQMITNTPSNYQFLAFLMCAGLIFVGIAPNFKKGLDRPVHITGASISAICSQIWAALIEPYSLLLWIPFLVYIGIRMKKEDGNLYDRFKKCKPLFWSESITFTIIYIISLFNI